MRFGDALLPKRRSVIAARRVSSGFGTDAAVGQRNNCRKIVLVSIKVVTFTPNFQYLKSVNAHLCTLKFTGLPIERMQECIG